MKHKHYYRQGYHDALTSGRTMPSWGQIGSVPAPAIAAYTDGWRDGREVRHGLRDSWREQARGAAKAITSGN